MRAMNDKLAIISTLIWSLDVTTFAPIKLALRVRHGAPTEKPLAGREVQTTGDDSPGSISGFFFSDWSGRTTVVGYW
jgi:hypothetical protein